MVLDSCRNDPFPKDGSHGGRAGAPCGDYSGAPAREKRWRKRAQSIAENVGDEQLEMENEMKNEQRKRTIPLTRPIATCITKRKDYLKDEAAKGRKFEISFYQFQF